MRREFAISALCHLLLLALLLGAGGKGNGKGGKGKGNGSSDGEPISTFIPKEGKEVMVDVVHMEEGLPDLKKPKEKKHHKQHHCRSSYGGIGVSFSLPWGSTEQPGTMIVGEVAKGYPAEEAGILVGDRILAESEIRGEPGTEVTITVVHRDGTSEQKTLVRDSICYEAGPRPTGP